MGQGRKPKPSKLKAIQGTSRKDRSVDNEMMPSLHEGLPDPPAELPEKAKLEWISVTRELYGLGMLHTVDLTLLAAYCNEISIYWACQAEVREKGVTIHNNQGNLVANPATGIGNKALSHAVSLAANFGFMPAARTKIGAPVKKPNDPMEGIL